MARVIVLPNADHLDDGIDGTTLLLVERIDPEHLDSLALSEQFLERLEWAVRGRPPRRTATRDYRAVPVG